MSENIDQNEQRHKTIWLSPWCDGCERHCTSLEGSRTWCAENAFEPCDECGREPVKYELAAVRGAEP